MTPTYAYYRVSTEKQELQGFSLEAQQTSVRDFAAVNDYEIVGEFEEIESGGKNDRPVLRKVLKLCKRKKAALLIARMDRLSRRVAFISSILESKVKVVIVEYPVAQKTELHFLAVLAEWQLDYISKRTKEAMAYKKSQGSEFGTYAKNILSKQNKDKADAFAMKMQPIINQIVQDKGRTSVRKIAAELKIRKVKNYSGRITWNLNSTYNLLKRIDAINQSTHCHRI